MELLTFIGILSLAMISSRPIYESIAEFIEAALLITFRPWHMFLVVAI